MDHTTSNNGDIIDRKSATKNQGENDHDDEDRDDDDDLSSLGDASPMNEAAQRQKERMKLAHSNMRKFLGVLMAVAYLIFQFSSFSSKSAIHAMSGDSIYSSTATAATFSIQQETTNMTKIMRQQHLSQVATKLSKVYKPTSPNVWCIDGRLKYEQGKRRPMGLCYLKIPRAASTYLAGINQRIARNFAKRHSDSVKKPCIRHDGHVPGMYYTKRDPLSYLWTFVRNPTDRSLSRVANSLTKRGIASITTSTATPTTVIDGEGEEDGEVVIGTNKGSHNMNVSSYTIHALHTDGDVQYGAVSAGRGGFQLQYSMLHMIEEHSAWNDSHPEIIVNPTLVQQHVRGLMNGYDFIGLVERMDESLVALKLLLGLETSDILQFPSKTYQQYYRRKMGPKRFQCQLPMDPNSLKAVPDVRNYLDSQEWFAQNYGDELLWEAASISLDRTILKIGLPTFSNELKEYRALKALAFETCTPQFPCSDSGADQSDLSEEDCYDGDHIGCGYACLDNLNITTLTDVRRR